MSIYKSTLIALSVIFMVGTSLPSQTTALERSQGTTIPAAVNIHTVKHHSGHHHGHHYKHHRHHYKHHGHHRHHHHGHHYKHHGHHKHHHGHHR